MRTISYNSIRLTLLEFKQRRMALVHGTKMLVLLFLAGFSWQSAVADSVVSTRGGTSSTNTAGNDKPTAAGSSQYTTYTVSPSRPELQANDQITYTVHVHNTGTTVLSNVLVIDTVPANTSLFFSGGGAVDAFGEIVGTIPSIAIGDSALFTFIVKVNSPVLPTTSYIHLTSYVDIGDGIRQPATRFLNVPVPAGEYALSIPVNNGLKAVAWKTQEYTPSGANGYIQAGDIIRYVIWVRNTGTVNLTNVLVTDFVPSYTGFVMALGGGTKDANDQVSWTIPALPVGAQDSMSFFVRVATDLTGASGIENTAYVDIHDGKPLIKTVPGDASGTEPSTLPPGSGPTTFIQIKSITSFETWKTAINDTDPTSTTVSPEEDIEYIIYVRNTGNVSITSLLINDNIPIGTTFKSVRDGGSFSEGDDNTAVKWEISNVAAGAILTVHFTVTVDKFVQDLDYIANTAKVKTKDTTLETIGCDPLDPTCNKSKKGTTIKLAGAKAGQFVSNVVTPNGDGKNDFFVVRSIVEKYPNSALHVYNRWGNEVYQSKNYSNSWAATGLSEGTYYYVLELNDAGKITVIKGWVMIIR